MIRTAEQDEASQTNIYLMGSAVVPIRVYGQTVLQGPGHGGHTLDTGDQQQRQDEAQGALNHAKRRKMVLPKR